MICIILVALDLRNVGVFAVKHKARDEVLRTYVANLVRTLQMVAWSCQWKVCFVQANTDQSHDQTHLQAKPLKPFLRHPAKNIECYQGSRPLRFDDHLRNFWNGRDLLICCAASLSLDHSPCTAGVTQAVCECVGLEVVRGSGTIKVVAIFISCSWCVWY